MLITKAARRYASALLQLAKERDEVEDILDDIELIRNTIDNSHDLVVFLRSPVIKYDDKVQALSKLFDDRVNEATARFIALLARKKRANILDQIVEAFIEQYYQYVGITEVEVYTAFELNQEQRQQLHSSLEKATGKSVKMNVTLDSSLKGGIAVRIDDTVIDGTVKHKLEELEKSFLSTTVE